MSIKQRRVYIVKVAETVVFCSTNLKAAWEQIEYRNSFMESSELRSYAQVTRILKTKSTYRFVGLDQLTYRIIRMPLYSKHAKPNYLT